MHNMTSEQIIVELAKRFGWAQEDPGGAALRFKIGGTVTHFVPDHEPKDAGMLIERLYGHGLREFHFEPIAGNQVRAYFENEAWAENGDNWKSATTRAALRALREKKIGGP